MTALAEKIEVIVEEPEVTILAPEVDDDEDETKDDVDTSEELEVPEGGIGGFVMSAEDMAVLAAHEAKKEFGDGGLAQFTEVAKKMAGHGRFGDDSVAHIQTGELVIPLTLFESNPRLKAQILKKLRDDGIEDPEQYVVGSKANSINPETGLMEFGSLSKIIRKIGKVLRKVIPIVLPIVLALTPLGPIWGAALGSGIGTLISGGSLGDAFKSALIGGAVGAVFSGFSGPEGSFGANVKAAAASPGARFGQALEGASSSASGAGWKGDGNLFSDFVPDPSAQIVNATAAATPALTTGPVNPGAFGNTGPVYQGATGSAAGSGFNIGPAGPDLTGTGATASGGAGTNVAAGTTGGAGTNAAAGTTGGAGNFVAPTEVPGFMDSIKDAFTPGGVGFKDSLSNAFFPGANAQTAQEILTANGISAINPSAAQLAAAQGMAQSVAPGMIRSYAPMLGLATAVGSATGAFDDPNKGDGSSILDLNEDGSVVTGVDLFEADRAKYLIHDLGAQRLNVETGEYEDVSPSAKISSSVPTNAPMPINAPMPSNISPEDYLMASGPGSPFARPYVPKAEGGPIYPRRNGGVAPSEGVPGQDSVRAMLMPGEFVMTTDAVRGLGGGNIDNGIKSMYTVMRNLESRGRATA